MIGFTEWDGTIYLCEYCVLSAMTVFEGLMIPGDEKALRDELNSVELKNARQAIKIKELEQTLESYKSVFSHSGIRSPGVGGNGPIAGPPPNGNDRVYVDEVPGFSGKSDLDTNSPNGTGARNVSELVAASAGVPVVSSDSPSEPDGDSGEQGNGERRNRRTSSRRATSPGEELGAI